MIRSARVLIPLLFGATGLVGCGAARDKTPIAAVTRPDNTTPSSNDASAGAPISALPLFPGDAGREQDDASPASADLIRHSFTTDGRDFDPDVDAATETIVFASTRNSERADLFLKHAQGATLTQITEDGADDIQPRFSPDGSRIAFASNRAGNWDIWIVKRDGTQPIQLTRDRADEVAPCWSPDGRQLAFTVWGRRSQQWEIWVVTVEDPAARRFVTNGLFSAWSPDGRKLAFQRARQRGSQWFSIWTIDLENDQARRASEVAHSDAAACIAPRWSPDGRYLVFTEVRRDVRTFGPEPRVQQAELWACDVRSGSRMKLGQRGVIAFNPVWAANGRVYFVSPVGSAENILSIPAGVTDEVAARPQLNATPIGEESRTYSESTSDE